MVMGIATRVFDMRFFALPFFMILALAAGPASSEVTKREGWAVFATQKPFEDLVSAVKDATKANGMGVVTEAGPTDMAASRGITIPGNRVIGVFNNDFAVKILRLSEAAMIEAPIRFYVTEQADGTAMLSYKKPSFVFGPYFEEGGEELVKLSEGLDEKFAAIADEAVN